MGSKEQKLKFRDPPQEDLDLELEEEFVMAAPESPATDSYWKGLWWRACVELSEGGGDIKGTTRTTTIVHQPGSGGVKPHFRHTSRGNLDMGIVREPSENSTTIAIRPSPERLFWDEKCTKNRKNAMNECDACIHIWHV